MDLVEATQAQAALAVQSQTNDYLLRRIFRWYSTTFHTPLADVDKQPIEFILQQFFEHSYENMEKATLTKTIKELIGDKSDDQSDEEFIKQTRDQAKAKVKIKKQKVKRARKNQKKLEEQDFLSAAEVLKQVSKVVKPKAPPLEKLPEIDMKFDSNLDE